MVNDEEARGKVGRRTGGKTSKSAGHLPRVGKFPKGKNPQTGNGPDDPDLSWCCDEEARDMPRGVYESMTFPSYVFQEYPKWVTNKAGQRVVVNSQSEEMGMLTTAEVSAKVDPLVAERDALALENAALQAQLAEFKAKTPVEAPTPSLVDSLTKAKGK